MHEVSEMSDTGVDLTFYSRPEGILNPEFGNLVNSSRPVPNSWPDRAQSSAVPLPTAIGTIAGCTEYRDFQKVSNIQDAFYNPKKQRTYKIVNECDYILTLYDISPNDFFAWNPSLNSTSPSCSLAPGFKYCVNHNNTSKSIFVNFTNTS